MALNTIKNLCSAKKWTKVHQIFLGDATPKTSHHAKFYRDRSNQRGDRGYHLGLGQIFFYFVTDRQKRDYLSRDSQRCER